MTLPPLPAAPPAVQRLLDHPKFGSGIGFQRMQALLGQLPNPAWSTHLDALKVTGSKGKGSTAAVAAEILRQLGLKTGLYTSPHLLRFNERIRINQNDINEADLVEACTWYDSAAKAYQQAFPNDHFAAFEAFTAVALHHFSHHHVQAVVAEAGIGGRYDTTRTFPGTTVALTSVELEHCELLGHQPEFIAYDKADLCPAGGTLVVGRIEPELVRRLRAYTRDRGIQLVDIRAEAEVGEVEFVDWRMRFSLRCLGCDFGRLETPLLGEHQAWNIAVAATAVRNWLHRHRSEVGVEQEQFREAVRNAAASVKWPGRLERLSLQPETIIDVGHTPQSMRAIVAALRSMPSDKPVLLVTGVSYNKDIRGVLAELLPVADAVVCTAAWYKGAPATEIEQHVRALRPDVPVQVIPTLEEATAYALERATRENARVLFAGGLFLAIEAMATLQHIDPRSLRFA